MSDPSEAYRHAIETRGAQMGAPETRQRIQLGEVEERQRIPGTNHSVRISGWGNPTLTAAVSAASELAADNIPATVGAGVAAEVAQRYRHLSDAEAAVFDLLVRLANGGSIYRVWIDEKELVDAMDADVERDARRRLLANMRSRDLLEEAAGKWRAVR